MVISFQTKRRRFSPLDNPVLEDDTIRSTVESIEDSMRNENEVPPAKVVRLSNKDRLLLRKQALKIKKRPVLAVGISTFFSSGLFLLSFVYIVDTELLVVFREEQHCEWCCKTD